MRSNLSSVPILKLRPVIAFVVHKEVLFTTLLQVHPMEINDESLKAIADELLTGMKCFLNKETLELVSFPDENKYGDFDSNDWREEIDQVKNSPHSFIEIQPRNANEAFRAMEWFIDGVENEEAKLKLTQAIAGKKPFANFELRLQEFPGMRDEWFAFNENCMIDFIRQQLS
jgi:hypothetical protein